MSCFGKNDIHFGTNIDINGGWRSCKAEYSDGGFSLFL